MCGGTTNHDFTYALPSGVCNGTAHDIYTYAIGVDVNGNLDGQNPLLPSSPRTITCTPPAQASERTLPRLSTPQAAGQP